MKPEDEKIKQGIKQVGEAVNKQVVGGVTQMVMDMTKHGKLPREAWNISDAKIEEMYDQAYRLYNTGKYKQSAQLFRLLIMINADEPKYALGLAACFHMMKEYKNAIETYTLCSILDGKDPVPLFHSSDCFIQSGDKFSALVVLEMAVKKAGDDPKFQVLKDRALMTIEGLKKEMPEKKTE